MTEQLIDQSKLETTEEERASWKQRADDAGRLARDFARIVEQAWDMLYRAADDNDRAM